MNEYNATGQGRRTFRKTKLKKSMCFRHERNRRNFTESNVVYRVGYRVLGREHSADLRNHRRQAAPRAEIFRKRSRFTRPTSYGRLSRLSGSAFERTDPSETEIHACAVNEAKAFSK